MAIIVCPIYDAFDKCNTPWNWIISIFYILGWAAWFLFILMVVMHQETHFPLLLMKPTTIIIPTQNKLALIVKALRKIVPMFNELLIGQKATYNRDYKNNLASTILHELAEIRTFVELAKNTVKWEHFQFYADLLDCLIEEGANLNYWCNNYYRAMKEVMPYGCILTRLHKLQKRESTNPATNIEYLLRVLKIAPGIVVCGSF